MNSSAATTNTTSGQERRSNQLSSAAPSTSSGEGIARSSAVRPSTLPRMRVEMPSKNTLPCVFTYSMMHRYRVADRDLVIREPALEAERAGSACRCRSMRGERRAAIEGSHALQATRPPYPGFALRKLAAATSAG